MEKLGTILVDSPPDIDPSIAVEFLQRTGHPVEVCGGPEGGSDCPIVVGQRCPKIESARGVVFSFDLDRPQHRAILAKYEEMVPEGTPLRVVVRPGQEQTYRDILAGVQVWTHKPTVGELDGFSAQVEAAD